MNVIIRRIAPFNFVKLAIFLVCAGLSIYLTSSSALAETKKKPDASVKGIKGLPEDAVKQYIDYYLSRKLNLLAATDANMVSSITNAIKRAPVSLKKVEQNKAYADAVEYININEQDKFANGTSLKNVMGMLGGSGSIPFFKVLYRNMSYKILEVRNKTVRGPFDEMANYSKEAFVELSYGDPSTAPSDNNQKVKKAIVLVQLQEWYLPAGNYYASNYKVLGYTATDYGIEYF